ncbi:LOW QUALITY PROTEIN: DDB1- and CUL4-associated factor 11 [Heliangelus exortis]|uniref:LOW QUALITY PROTEIN: DDB1- and CUL4-associated factor 11 n=1 Tax=Heliangelus exortis TaxID=472823 RepID=UPI003A8E8637
MATAEKRSPDPQEEEEEEEEEEAAAPPPAPLEAPQLCSELLLAAGRGGAGPRPIEENLPRAIRQRELGGCRWGCFSLGDRLRLSSHFLPNAVTFATSYPHKAFCGLFAPDGSIFVSAAQDQYLRFYSPSPHGFRFLRSSRARSVAWSILDVAFTPDSSQCLYSSWADAIHVFDVHGEGETHTALELSPPERRFAVFSLAVGPGGCEVLGGGSDGCVYGYDRGAQRRVLRFPAHDDDVNAVALGSASGRLLLSGGDDGICRAWDLREPPGRAAAQLGGHRDGVTALHPRGDDRYVVSNSKDQTAKLWDLRQPTGPRGVEAARRAAARQNWDYRWQRAPREALTSRPLPGDTSLMTYRGHSVLHTLVRCRLSPPEGSAGGHWLATGCASGCVIIYDVMSGRVLRRLANHGACVRDVSWHPTNGSLASASWDGSVRLWGYRGEEEEEEEGAGPPAGPLPPP